MSPRPLILPALLLLAAVGLAHAAGPAWQYRVKDRIKPGQPAEITLSSANDAFDVKLVLKGPDGRNQTFHAKKLPAGKAQTFRWAVPAGVSEWTGELTGSADGATTTAPLTLKIAAINPLDVKLAKGDVDLAAGRVIIEPSHAVAKAEVKAFGDGGAVVVDEEVDLAGATGRVPVEFTVNEGDVIKRLELKIHDEFGFWVGLRVVSWFAEIPHEDVVFESGKWDVRPTEAHKIDNVFATLEREIARFKAELGDEAVSVDLKIYVAGFTDTVGAPGDNQVLSDKRARAIAAYFRQHGVKLPVYYQGFGEAALAVATADGVDEPQNRRATYVLANVPPGGRAFPGARWKKLD
ncbi:MAG: OmpA family protein [Myxococcales bacterium]|nr:OmpA family protein [Myxococcales bacterium]MCB9547363.1 OmpA family protein [Myxococcales bacterium]